MCVCVCARATLQLRLEGGHLATIISCYAPTLPAPQEEKDQFYEQLSSAITAVPHKHKLFVLGDFNARVGRDQSLWPKVIGRHGVGKENANGSSLLQLCSMQKLTILNTVFQQASKYKFTWMHPRSHHWHLIDYVLTRQRDLRHVRHTRAVRGSEAWSDHRLVKCTVFMSAKSPKRQHGRSAVKKLDVCKLQDVTMQVELQSSLSEALADSSTDEWPIFKKTVFATTAKVIGYQKSHHKDWFDDQDGSARHLQLYSCQCVQ